MLATLSTPKKAMQANFVKPRYDAGGFASLPQRISDMVTANQYDALVLFLIDGFGWRSFEKFQSAPFFEQVTRLGTVSKLTSQFPSTTAAHITTLHTGLPVGEHGIFEWYYYEPTLDAVIAPLLFSYAGTPERDTLKPTGVKARSLFPFHPVYRRLKKQGISSTIFQAREYTPSTYSEILFGGATTRSFKTLTESLVNLTEALAKCNAPSYFLVYFDKIDSISHEYGPESAQTTAEIQTFLLVMEHIFLKTMATPKKKILFLLTADHGQSETDPKTTLYINRDPAFAGVEKFLKTNNQGHLIVPAGSARDFFLYIKPGLVNEAQAFLSSRLEGRAEVQKVADLADEGYFGPVVSPVFCSRAGDLVILPYRGESVWWFEKDHFEQRFLGHHGGLTAQEMEIPLLMWE